MTETELKRKTILDKADDRRITQKAAATALGISERQVRRILRRYRKDGNEELVSMQRGKPGNRRLKEEVAEKIKQFIGQPMMTGFKPTLMREKLEEVSGIRVSKETLRKMMITENLHVAKVKKPKAIHPPRERRERRGEPVQIDGSYHSRLDGKPLELVIIDKYSQPASVVTNKSNAQVPVPPAVDHPWRTYGKKLNDNPRATIH